MKKGFLLALVVAGMLFLLMPASTTHAAYTSIEGVALTSDGTTRWAYGGTVTVSITDDGSNYYDCTTSLSTTPGNLGYYTIDFNGTNCPGFTGPVADFSIIGITANFNAGPPPNNYDPPDYNGLAFNLNSSSGPLYHDINTQSGPTAVSLQNVDVNTAQSSGALLLIIAVLAIATFFVIRRRATQ